MFLRFSKIRNVKSPNRSHPTDAGIDFYVPEIDDKFIEEVCKSTGRKINEKIIISPGNNFLIPSGIKVEIPFGFMGIFLNKSSIASKNELLIGAQVIDTFYSGEVHIDLHNVGKEYITLRSGAKIAQMVIVPAINCGLIECEESELYKQFLIPSYRNSNGFGSTESK